MGHKTILLLASALGLAAAQVASAADMPVKAPAAIVAQSWSGCYVGLQAGYKFGSSRQEYGGLVNGVPNAFLPVGFDMAGRYNVKGLVGGGEAGCNYQVGSIVYGIEIDGSASAAVGKSDAAPEATALGLNSNFDFTTNERWLVTARGRIGYTVDKWLWYVTGGVAYSGFDVNNFNGTGVATAQRNPTRVNRVGWVVGLGSEYALGTGWSVKSEWLYANFGTFHYGDEPGVVNGCTAGCANADVKMYEHILRVGLNYKLGWTAPRP